MGTFTFRYAEETDAALILRFIRELADYEKMLDEVIATEELLKEWICEKKKAEVIFALEDGVEAGFALFFHNFSTFLGRAGIYLEDLYVSPQYRGKGYGKATVKKVIEKCEELSALKMVLGAKYDKKGFYESLGFSTYGEIFEEEGIPHIMMQIEID